jgi:hypothetical protein
MILKETILFAYSHISTDTFFVALRVASSKLLSFITIAHMDTFPDTTHLRKAFTFQLAIKTTTMATLN